jgi:hypothetical protein
LTIVLTADGDPVLVSSRDAIELELKSFTGAPAYSADGDMIVPHQDPVKYTGLPSPEIDMAWDKLVDGKSQQPGRASMRFLLTYF